MAYVPVPKDLSKVKNKIVFNLTKRQLICFGISAIIGIPLYLTTKNSLGNSIAIVLLMIVAFPGFFFAIKEKNGLHYEKYLKYKIDTLYIRPTIRVYKTENVYKVLAEPLKTDERRLNESDKRAVSKNKDEKRKSPKRKA